MIILHTNKGDIKIELDPKKCTAEPSYKTGVTPYSAR